MSSGRATKTKNNDDGFAQRTVQAMACEMIEARGRMNTLFIQFEALAISMGVVVNWSDTTNL